jgi:hypothetical protein
MSSVYDNIEQPLLPELKAYLKEAYRADFCVGYFNLRGGRQIDADIEQFQDQRIFITKNGDLIEYEEFSASQSKLIIDEIDRVLAQHYGFTAEELDFMINYDIKYHMGRDNGGDE